MNWFSIALHSVICRVVLIKIGFGCCTMYVYYYSWESSLKKKYPLILCYWIVRFGLPFVEGFSKKTFLHFCPIWRLFKFQHTKMLWLTFFPIRFHSCRSLRDTHSVINRYFHRKNGRRDFIDFCHMNATLETINHFVFGCFML